MSDENKRDTLPPPPPTKAAKKPKAKPKPSADKKSPAEWMTVLRRYKDGPRRGELPRRRVPHWQHNAAAAMHGWDQHAHDEGEPIQLTQTDYEAALAATETNPLQPHKGALSKHSKHSFGG